MLINSVFIDDMVTTTNSTYSSLNKSQIDFIRGIVESQFTGNDGNCFIAHKDSGEGIKIDDSVDDIQKRNIFKKIKRLINPENFTNPAYIDNLTGKPLSLLMKEPEKSGVGDLSREDIRDLDGNVISKKYNITNGQVRIGVLKVLNELFSEGSNQDSFNIDTQNYNSDNNCSHNDSISKRPTIATRVRTSVANPVPIANENPEANNTTNNCLDYTNDFIGACIGACVVGGAFSLGLLALSNETLQMKRSYAIVGIPMMTLIGAASGAMINSSFSSRCFTNNISSFCDRISSCRNEQNQDVINIV